MKRLASALTLIAVSGCAAHRAPVADGHDPLRDWTSVHAIPIGTPVRLTLGYDIDGRLENVTDSTLTIRALGGTRRLTTDRTLVVRVAVLSQKKMPWRWLAWPLGLLSLGGLVGALAGAVMTDAEVAGVSLAVFCAGAFGFYKHYAYHRFDHEWRVVYVRP